VGYCRVVAKEQLQYNTYTDLFKSKIILRNLLVSCSQTDEITPSGVSRQITPLVVRRQVTPLAVSRQITPLVVRRKVTPLVVR
jgi:hypothetical protein